MADYRATMLFQQANAGWGESFYTNQASANTTLNELQSLVNRRVACIGDGVKVGAIRAQNIGGAGEANVRILNQAGTSTAVDTPWQSLIVHFRDEDGRRLVYLQRAIPDAQIAAGIFQPTPAYTAALRAYLDAVVAGPWTVRRLDKNQPLKRITSITTGGTLTCMEGHGLVAGDLIKMNHVNDIHGQPVRGDFQILTTPTPETATIANWTEQSVQRNGKFRKVAYVFKNITSYEYQNKITSRKVGRPFGSPRGRRSSR